MPRATFIEPDGKRRTIQIAVGTTLLEGARANGIAGIEGTCGGECACTTCHCYVEKSWLWLLPTMSPAEGALLATLPNRRDSSRLTCQLSMKAMLDGIILKVV